MDSKYTKWPQELINTFHAIYNNDKENLKKVPTVLIQMGVGYMDILLLTKSELNLGLGEAIMLLEIPDVYV